MKTKKKNIFKCLIPTHQLTLYIHTYILPTTYPWICPSSTNQCKPMDKWYNNTNVPTHNFWQITNHPYLLNTYNRNISTKQAKPTKSTLNQILLFKNRREKTKLFCENVPFKIYGVNFKRSFEFEKEKENNNKICVQFLQIFIDNNWFWNSSNLRVCVWLSVTSATFPENWHSKFQKKKNRKNIKTTNNVKKNFYNNTHHWIIYLDFFCRPLVWIKI